MTIESTIQQQSPAKNMSTVTIRNGYWFFFEDQGTEIAVNASAFSGKETVYMNDNPVSEKRSMGVISLHNFQYNGKHYRIKFDVLNILTQKIECTLYVDGKIHSTETKAYITGGWKGFVKQFFSWVGFGALTGFIMFFLIVSFFDI
jgi:hypothetical protein